jgi:hypothetical protein
VQPSLAVVLASSQVSPVSTMPLPQVFAHVDGFPLHA